MVTVNILRDDVENGIRCVLVENVATKEQGKLQFNTLKDLITAGSVKLHDYVLDGDDLVPVLDAPGAGLYQLMNKDAIVAVFSPAIGVLEQYGNLPYGFSNAKDWLDSRAKFSCARDVKSFFSSIGINNTEQLINVTHCVALYDSFWVREKDSTWNWCDVSPFRHNYSNVISTYALEGVKIGNEGKNYFSPVVSTDGSFPHTWKYNGGNIVFIKAGSKYTLGGSNSGREPFSEYYASEVAEYLGFNHVTYRIREHVRHDGRVDVVTECDCFTSEEIGTVTANNLGLHSYEDVLEYCKQLSDKDYGGFLDMLFLDCLLLNTDRHFSNIEFFVDNASQRVLGLTPIFDNNFALLPRFIEGYDTFSRDDYRARDNRTFDDLWTLVHGRRSYNRELVQLRKFKFVQPKGVSISTERLQFLNDFLQLQVEWLSGHKGLKAITSF